MIPIVPILISIGVGATVAVIVSWKELVSWAKNLTKKIKEKLKFLEKKMMVLVEKTKKGMKFIHTLFYKGDTGWIEEKTEAIISENQVPEDIIRAYEMHRKNDGLANVTPEMEMEMSMAM